MTPWGEIAIPDWRISPRTLPFCSGTLRRLSERNNRDFAVFNMATQFGGGNDSCSDTVVAKGGESTHSWSGVSKLMSEAGIAAVPSAAPVFVGSELIQSAAAVVDGTPLR